jgi:Uma2 family endonuclease
VAQYQAMAKHGILTSEDRVELIQGYLVAKMTKNPPHAISTALVRDALQHLLPSGWHSRTQDPITLTDSEPEPDTAVIRGQLRDYRSRHPGPGDVALVVEVADSTIAYDRNVKKPVYAAASIPTYWIVNLEDNHLEVYTDPGGPGTQPDYASYQILQPTDPVAVVLDGHEVGRILVRDLLP